MFGPLSNLQAMRYRKQLLKLIINIIRTYFFNDTFLIIVKLKKEYWKFKKLWQYLETFYI